MPRTNNTCLTIDILQEEEEKIALHQLLILPLEEYLGQKTRLVIWLHGCLLFYIYNHFFRCQVQIKVFRKMCYEFSHDSMMLCYFYFAYVPLFPQDVKGLLHLKHSRTQY